MAVIKHRETAKLYCDKCGKLIGSARANQLPGSDVRIYCRESAGLEHVRLVSPPAGVRPTLVTLEDGRVLPALAHQGPMGCRRMIQVDDATLRAAWEGAAGSTLGGGQVRIRL